LGHFNILEHYCEIHFFIWTEAMMGSHCWVSSWILVLDLTFLMNLIKRFSEIWSPHMSSSSFYPFGMKFVHLSLWNKVLGVGKADKNHRKKKCRNKMNFLLLFAGFLSWQHHRMLYGECQRLQQALLGDQLLLRQPYWRAQWSNGPLHGLLPTVVILLSWCHNGCWLRTHLGITQQPSKFCHRISFSLINIIVTHLPFVYV
jgi:hypothetical protein